MKNLHLLIALISVTVGNLFAMDLPNLTHVETEGVTIVSTSVIIDPLEQNTHIGFLEQATQQLNVAQPDYTEVRETLLDWLHFIKQNQNTAHTHAAFAHVQTLRDTIHPHLQNTRLNRRLDVDIAIINELINNTQADH